ncbi:acetyltransferase [Maridesulfovibrio zosterae]|uniref:acetyltransferase n=1 Tax=Maridesulfovibrio zosterae TaxID=82171 RepID=UPI000409BD0F|nr:acetyltransferase [Maridesulfovibrio zosterae]
MKKILIFGAGGHGQVVADALLLMDGADPAAFLDDGVPAGTKILGIPVTGGFTSYREIPHDGIVLALGNAELRKKIFKQLTEDGEKMFTVIHPSTVISPNVKIGDGCMIMAGAVINTGAEIKDNTIINTNSTIEHHNSIGPHSHIAPGSTLGGEVVVGEESMVGIGATVLPRINMGSRSTLGAGSTAIKNIPDDTTWVGTPAKELINK